MEKIRVGIADYQVALAPASLVAYGLGSCLAVAIYDDQNKTGGLAHALLPAPLPIVSISSPATYVETAVTEMVAHMERQGSARTNMTAKLIGGSQMFEAFSSSIEAIGVRNLKKATEVLGQLGIPIVGEETGGNQGRSLEFDLATGRVEVFKVRAAEPTVL